eukprot:Nk52_evm19s2426 gene=Nk52_evmTU19s2426
MKKFPVTSTLPLLLLLFLSISSSSILVKADDDTPSPLPDGEVQYNKAITSYLPEDFDYASLDTDDLSLVTNPLFYGLHLDVELHALKGYNRSDGEATQARLRGVMELFEMVKTHMTMRDPLMKEFGWKVAADMPYWYAFLMYRDPVEESKFPQYHVPEVVALDDGNQVEIASDPDTYNWRDVPYYKIILDIVDGLNVMAYRNSADRVAFFSEAFLDHSEAETPSKDVTVAVESICPPKVPASITFCGASDPERPELSSGDLLEETFEFVDEQFSTKYPNTYAGFSVHYYEAYGALFDKSAAQDGSDIQLNPGKASGRVERAKQMFVWESETILEVDRRQAMLDFSVKMGVTDLYLYAEYILPLCGKWEALRETLKAAHASGIHTSLLVGQPTWTFDHEDAMRYMQFTSDFLALDGVCPVKLHADCSGEASFVAEPSTEDYVMVRVNSKGLGNIRVQIGDLFSWNSQHLQEKACRRFDYEFFQSEDLNDVAKFSGVDSFDLLVKKPADNSPARLSFWSYIRADLGITCNNVEIEIPTNANDEPIALDLATHPCWGGAVSPPDQPEPEPQPSETQEPSKPEKTTAPAEETTAAPEESATPEEPTASANPTSTEQAPAGPDETTAPVKPTTPEGGDVDVVDDGNDPAGDDDANVPGVASSISHGGLFQLIFLSCAFILASM